MSSPSSTKEAVYQVLLEGGVADQTAVGRGHTRPTITTELGVEMLCRSCDAKGEPDPWWPVDDAFWFIVNDRPSGHCRACFSERERVDGRRMFPSLGLAGAA